MSIEVEGPDGAIHEFPDETSQDVIKGVMAKHYGLPAAQAAPAPAAAAPAEPSTWDKVKGAAAGAGRIARDFGSGVVNAATSPVDLAAAAYGAEKWAADKLGVPEVVLRTINPAGNIASIVQPYVGAEAANKELGLANEGPRNPVEKGVGRVAQELGAMAVPVGAGLRLAKRGVDAVRESSPVVRFLAEKAAVDPTSFLAKEAAVATTAGTGAALAGGAAESAYGPDAWQTKAADLAGALGGVGAAGAASHIAPKAVEIGKAVTRNPGYVDKVVNQAVTDDLARMFGAPDAQLGPKGTYDTAPAVTAIESGKRVSDVIPGFVESLATRTQSPVVAAVEQSRQNGKNSGLFATRQAANSEAIDNALSANAPNGQPGALRAALADERDSRLVDARNIVLEALSRREAGAEDAKRTLDLLKQGHASDLEAAQAAHRDAQAVAAQSGHAAIEGAQAPLAPTMNADARGADIRDVLTNALENARAQEREAWAPVARGGQIDVAPLADRFGAITNGLSEAERGRFVPAEAGIPARLMPEAAGAPSPTGLLDASGAPITRAGAAFSSMQPLSELTGLRSALTDAARQAATAGEANKARVIGQYIDALDAHLDASMPAEAKAAYDQARSFSRDLNDRFTRPQTAIGQTLAETQGLPRTPDNAVPRKFTQRDEGNVSSFDALQREAAGDPRAMAAVRDQVLEDASKALDNPAAIRRFLDQNSRTLDAFPEVRDQLSQLENAHMTAAQKLAALKDFERNGVAGLKRVQAQELAATRAQTAQQEAELTKSAREAAGAENRLLADLGNPATGAAGRSAVGQYLRFGDENSEKAMRGVMNSADPAKAADDLLNFAGNDPASVEGARQIFWNMMSGQGKNSAGVWASDRLGKFLDTPGVAAVADRLYRDNPEHLENIKKIAEAVRGVDLQAAKAQAPKLTGADKSSWLTSHMPAETVQSRILSYERGQIGGAFLATTLAATLFRRAVRESQGKAIERVLDRALTEPDFAAQLLKENNPANRAALARGARGWLGNEASTLTQIINEEDDPIKKAVRGRR